MKTKMIVLALVLAMCVGMPGMTAQANGQPPHICCSDECDCRCTCGCNRPHCFLHERTDYNRSYYNPTSHLVVETKVYECTNCSNSYTVENVTYEDHDYEQTYLENGRVFTRCRGCGDSYYY